MKSGWPLIVSAAAAFAWPVSASADDFVTSSSFTLGATGALDYFDTSLGTLNSATAVLTFSGTELVTVLGTSFNGYTFTASGPGAIGSPTALNLGYAIDGPSFHFTMPASGLVTFPVDYAGTGHFFTDNAADLGSFVGSGQFAFSALGSIAYTATNPIRPSEVLPATGGHAGVGTLTLTYDYSPRAAAVPEPATWAMMILGFGLIGGAMRGRKATVRHA